VLGEDALKAQIGGYFDKSFIGGEKDPGKSAGHVALGKQTFF
jgi:hypothetical protein